MLSTEDAHRCEKILKNWSIYVSLIGETHFTESVLVKLVAHELETRRRKDVLYRLTARYNKLRRKREWAKIQEVLDAT